MAVIESPEYLAEEKRLAKDPIIIDMERTLPAGVDLDSWEFISAAMREYGKRGGKLSQSIGGPARGIARVRRARSGK